jgi:hypothetical protein
MIKKRQYKRAIPIVIYFMMSVLIGCHSFSPTKPNEVFKGAYPPFFEYLKENNSLISIICGVTLKS